ncbi:MAG: sulfotransferase family protein [Actinomycetota bacterium]
MLPTFLVIGAMKSGTTSLHAYLGAHPDVFMAEPKELDFFVEGKNLERGLDWYEERFGAAGDARARGEASTNYTKHPFFPDVPERIARVIPDVRLIYVVRHPIRRMVSQYLHHVAEYGERKPAAEALLSNPMIFALSDYATQIERYLDHFSREQILIVTSEDLYGRRAETMRTIYRFVGADDEKTPPTLDRELHRTRDKAAPTALAERMPFLARLAESPATPRSIARRLSRLTARRTAPESVPVPAEVERILRERLRPTVERLRAYMPPEFDGWGIG